MLAKVVRGLSLAIAVSACSNDDGSPTIIGPNGTGGVNGGGAASSGGSIGTSGGSTPTGTGGGLVFGGNNAGGGGGTDSGGTCASQSAKAEVLPVYLAFAFDVSGSMGQGDQPWHDRTLKWDPVTAATKAFFTDPASAGLSASVTFFPAASNKCTDGAYMTPDVPMTPLPSPAHGAAIDMIGSQTWRGGTPTLNVMHGVIANVRQAAMTTPGRYVIVLVTDGYPQGCNDNEITSVANVVSAVAGTIPTYVIGVANPPIQGAPDTVTNLTQVAMAGGTDHAYIIDTGNPTQTAATFKATIDSIRGAAISCDAKIPPAPTGSTFDKQKVAVTYTSSGAMTPLTYDASCMMANSWHYDDAANPQHVVLCPNTCTTIQSDPNGALSVEFSCKTQIQVPL
ncbi:MAG TPA: vWA domain-containing protein [Polyangiaceae bacterium]|jgi:hypothetical protein|nr:vWA domain-containing protein [Polyangiaceae bacterium]